MTVTHVHSNTIHLPQPSGNIARPRLLTRLCDPRKHNLTLILAPTGYGKTVLAAQLANQQASRTVWCTLEYSHQDVFSLFYRLVMTIKQQLSDIDTLLNTSRHRSTELALLITHYLSQYGDDDFVLILDNIHVVCETLPTTRFLWVLVESLPPNWQLVLVGRNLPDWLMEEWASRAETHIIGVEDLKFTHEDTYQLATRHSKSFSASETERLTEWLDGWAIGLTLALHRKNPHQIRQRGTISFGDFFRKLGGEALATQPKGLYDFLLASSTVTKLSTACCTEALDISECTCWIDDIQHKNLCVLKIGDTLIYHGLFRDLLQYQLRKQSPDEFNRLHIKAARWSEQAGDLDQAFNHYLTANEVGQAITLAEKCAVLLFTQGLSEQLLKWQMQLGAQASSAPQLQYNCARIHAQTYEYALAHDELTHAETRFRENRDEAGAINVQLCRAALNVQNGRAKEAIAEIAPLLAVDKKLDHKRARAYRILGEAHLRSGEIEVATIYLEKALALYESNEQDSVYIVAHILQALGTAYLKQGRTDEARDCLCHVVELNRWLGCPGRLAMALDTLGHFYHLTADYPQALRTFREGLKLTSILPNKQIRSTLVWHLGDLKRDQGHFEQAHKYYRDALDLAGEHDPLIRGGVQLSLATLHRWQGNLLMAVNAAEAALATAKDHAIVAYQAEAEIARWAAFGQLDQAPEAFANLAGPIDDLSKQNEHIVQIEGYVLRVTAALNFDHQLAADAWATVEAMAGDLVQPLIAEMAHTPQLEAYLKQSGSHKRVFIEHKLAELRGIHTIVSSNTRPTGPALYVTTLGQEHILYGGQPVILSNRKASKPRGLLYLLLFNGPQSREQISCVFWPDDDDARVRGNFHSTLYRMRQAMGSQTIQYDPDEKVYFIDPTLPVWCDALEFERLTQQARAMSTVGTQAKPIWQQAINLYHGDLLLNWPDEWVLNRRRILQDAYIEALLVLGDMAFDHLNFREALEWYQQVLAVDEYKEDAHRGIMRCYAELGEKQHVRAQFDRLSQHLATHWQIGHPSQQTQRLLKQLLEKNDAG